MNSGRVGRIEELHESPFVSLDSIQGEPHFDESEAGNLVAGEDIADARHASDAPDDALPPVSLDCSTDSI